MDGLMGQVVVIEGQGYSCHLRPCVKQAVAVHARDDEVSSALMTDEPSRNVGMWL